MTARATAAPATVLVLLALVGSTGSLAPAQPPPGWVGGAVTGPDDRPITGATVRVWPSEARGEAIFETATDGQGRWRLLGLEPGRWQLEVTARGYYPARGWFQVPAARPETTVDVELRSLEETSPSFAENRSTIVRWLEKGNALLEQSRPGAARAEYEKALGALPREERPQVLQAIARTYFLEGEIERSIEALQQAIGIAPDDAELRQLFLNLLASADRLDEAPELLEEAARAAVETGKEGGVAGIEPAVGTAPPPTGEGSPFTPSIEAVAGRSGRFRTVLSARSPLSGVETYLERFELSGAELRATDPAGGVYDLASESFELFVPESHAEDRPHGLLVWISPTPYGGFRNPEFERVLAEHQLIWIGAHDAGNGRWGWYRVGLALDAVHNARKLYAIDPRRIYVAGYSGGGRIASQLAMLYPEVFSGGFFVYGCDWFEPLPVPDRPGSLWPARFAAPPESVLERLRSGSRFVLLTGDRDFNRSQTKQIYKRMRARGFENVTYLQIPGADHYFGLPAEWLERGLAGLDGGFAARP